jgi:membrane associated rhomboid family serine protease
MTDSGLLGFILIIATVAFSYKGFTNDAFMDRYCFQVDRILIDRDYKRLLTSGFLHVNWLHLFFNMFSLYVFSGTIEYTFGTVKFLVLYFVSLIAGNLFSLFVHRNHGEYRAVGASGAICGIIFACIAIFPGFQVGFFFIPIPIPGWIFAIVFIAVSIYGIRSDKDNIGHDAHLGGALIGMLVALLFYPEAFAFNYPIILVVTITTIAFIYLIVTRPHVLFVNNLFFKKHSHFYSIDHKYNRDKREQQQEIDRILDKISEKGIKSLTTTEKEKLKRHSRGVR